MSSIVAAHFPFINGVDLTPLQESLQVKNNTQTVVLIGRGAGLCIGVVFEEVLLFPTSIDIQEDTGSITLNVVVDLYHAQVIGGLCFLRAVLGIASVIPKDGGSTGGRISARLAEIFPHIGKCIVRTSRIYCAVRGTEMVQVTAAFTLIEGCTGLGPYMLPIEATGCIGVKKLSLSGAIIAICIGPILLQTIITLVVYLIGMGIGHQLLKDIVQLAVHSLEATACRIGFIADQCIGAVFAGIIGHSLGGKGGTQLMACTGVPLCREGYRGQGAQHECQKQYDTEGSTSDVLHFLNSFICIYAIHYHTTFCRKRKRAFLLPADFSRRML